ncbi:type VI secretion system baseplate subunit TssE [Pseudomonas japonica]|uniref:type VI secretion system baseplate subunit TssE n=1 Tax=Pseudomonas japonica TaxID=256466 RepID=UPI003823B25C
MTDASPSLYEILLQNFNGELDLYLVNEDDQHVLSVLDNLQRILNSRAGALAHVPGFGLPDLSQVLQDMASSARSVMDDMSATVLAYEPRLKDLRVEMLAQSRPGHLEYALFAEFWSGEKVTFGTTLGAEGRLLVRHLKRQRYLATP